MDSPGTATSLHIYLKNPSLSSALVGGFVVRIALILYGAWQDENLIVKYSDIDYQVFSDAAYHVWSMNGSPYSRTTYRYTPLLAWMVTPNIFAFRWFGKLLFVGCDLVVGWLIFLDMKRREERKAIQWSCFWLFHPFSINISTRGNADAVICLLLVAMLHFFATKRLTLAAMVYGLAVHFRIFPIFFAPALLLHINDKFFGNQPNIQNSPRPIPLQAFGFKILFGCVSGGVFLLLGLLFYRMYGWEFLFETYLYHLVRTDNRHNFSVYFYSLYLHYGEDLGYLAGLGSFLPQIVVQLSAALLLYDDLPLCLCIQTMCFVAFNKVCTAQYFAWYTCLLPFVLSRIQGPIRNKIFLGFAVPASWLCAELLWLYFAYHLEFHAENVFFQVWLASIVFFVANISSIGALSFVALNDVKED